jgi:hypothetical protein
VKRTKFDNEYHQATNYNLGYAAGVRYGQKINELGMLMALTHRPKAADFHDSIWYINGFRDGENDTVKRGGKK